MRARAFLAMPVLLGLAWIGQPAATQGDPDLAALLERVGARVAVYHQRAGRLVCLERSTVLPIDARLGVQGFARTVESELRVDVPPEGGPGDARVVRDVLRVNGREPRERDRTDRAGCTDPLPLSPAPLAFLLPPERDEYRFTSVRAARERGRAALVIAFASERRRGVPELIEDPRGRDDCFDWRGPVPVAGRVWVDAATADVLRLERRLAGPTDIRVPRPLQRRYGFPGWVTIDRDDLSMQYAEVAFTGPDEVLLLPERIETLTLVRSSLQSNRRTQVYSDCRRFLADSRIVKAP